MKRSFIFIAAFCAGAILNIANAKDFSNLKEVANGHGSCALVEGSMSVLAEKANARLVLDYSNAHIVEFEKEHGVVANDLGTVDSYYATKTDEEREQWPQICENVYNTSVEKFNKSFSMKIKDENPKYEIKLVFDNIDFGSTIASAIGFRFHEEGGAEFNGNLIVTEIATGNVVLNLRVDDMKGANPSGYHYTANKRMICTIGDIFFGKYLPKLLSKNK